MTDYWEINILGFSKLLNRQSIFDSIDKYCNDNRIFVNILYDENLYNVWQNVLGHVIILTNIYMDILICPY